MTTNDDFNKNSDDFEPSDEGVNENLAADNGAGEASASSDGPMGEATDGADNDSADKDAADADAPDNDSANRDGTDRAGDAKHADDPDVDLPQLLRQVSRVLRREFRTAVNESGFDPRDFGRMRRGRRGWDTDELVADGGPGPEEPVTYGPPRGRRGWGPAGNVNPEEFRQMLRDLRDGVGDKVEDVLTSEEFEDLKAPLSKIVDAFGPDRCGDEPRRGGPDDRFDRDDHERWHRHDHGEGGRGDFRGDGDDLGDEHEDHRGGPERGGRRRGGRGRRGFGPGFGPGFGRFGPGFGPGCRGFDPFSWAEDRRDQERDREREVQEAFERGFAAGFEQGRNS
jgi:hypothetical protein